MEVSLEWLDNLDLLTLNHIKGSKLNLWLNHPFKKCWFIATTDITCRPISVNLNLFLPQIGDECLTCRNGVAAFNMSYFGKYYLTGPDAQKAADWIFTNDVRKPNGKYYKSVLL